MHIKLINYSFHIWLSECDALPISNLKSLKELLLRALTKHQILILNELKQNVHYFSVTNLIERVSERYDIAPSTLRWNVKRLQELELIDCGTSKKKGVLVKLTDSGELIYKILNRDCSSMGEHSNEDRGVRGSNPRSPIKKKRNEKTDICSS